MPPTFPNATGNLTTSGLNSAWGVRGSGSTRFWGMLNSLVYRDSGASAVGTPVGIQRKENFYYLISNTSMTYLPKARFEAWTVGDETGFIRVGPVVADRVDSVAQPLELDPGEDPSGQLRGSILEGLAKWGNFLPLIWFCRLLTNGRALPKYPISTCYDGQPLVSANHVVNPAHAQLRLVPISNLVQLAGPVDEAQWIDAKARLDEFPDLDGVTLPNAEADQKPLILCPSYRVAKRWIHFLGGPQLPKELLMQAANAAISSVVVGDAEVMWCPYLQTQKEGPATRTDANFQFDPAKRSYIFSRSGRKPVIFWEKAPPRVIRTRPDSEQAVSQDAEIMVARARLAMAAAEYRGLLAVDEP